MAVLHFGQKKKLPVWLTYLALFSRINFLTWSRHLGPVYMKKVGRGRRVTHLAEPTSYDLELDRLRVNPTKLIINLIINS